MKKIIYSFCTLVLFSVCGRAQSAMPNGGFETWTTVTCEAPTGYNNSNPSTFFQCQTPCNAVKSTDAYAGTYALELTTTGSSFDTCMGYVVSTMNPQGQNPCTWPGGTPITQAPTGIRGYYKCNVMPGDSAGILVIFKNGTNCLGMYMYKFAGVQNNYTLFNYTFNPPLLGTPDTMIFGAVSSDVFNNVQIAGSTFKIDSVSLVGVTQPAALNGSFENWTPTTFEKPDQWYFLGSSDQGSGVIKTTDKQAGQFAVELETWLGDNNGVPRAQAAGVSTGYYLNNCGGPNCQKGGFPFANQIDTLRFYYKFAPMGGAKADVYMQFKKNGASVWQQGMQYTSPASAYTYAEIPFNTGSPIDSVIVTFQSSQWSDTLMSMIGTNLKVDEAHFASQPLGTGIAYHNPNVAISVYPNPSANGAFTINNVGQFDLVRVYNVFGQEVNAKITKFNSEAYVSVPAAGAYFVYINSRGKVTNLKVVAGKE